MKINVHKSDNSEIPIGEAACGETDPILWCRSGEYCIIPVAVVKNAISVINSFNYLSDKTMHPEIRIRWSQGIPISNLAGRALVGE